MGDLDTYMDERFVRTAFATAGHSVLNVKAIKSKMTRTPAGYCFVEFSSTQNAENALNKLNGVPVPGTNPAKRFKLNWASYGKEGQSHGPEFSIFVGDLTPDVTDATLMEFFHSHYPSCKAAKVVIDNTGVSRGYGFVRFGAENERQRSLNEMQGARGCGGKAIRVSVATPKKATTNPSSSLTTQYNTANQQYLQQYQQFQQYLVAWQASYQQQTAQYYPGYTQYDPLYQQYQHDQNVGAVNSGSTSSYSENYEETIPDQTFEDPDAPTDVAAENRNFINKEESLFLELEESRWHPLESVTDGPSSLVA